MWPSGRATVFGTVDRRFESYHPSQILPCVPSGVNRNLSREKPDLCRVRAQLSPLSSVFWHYEWSGVPGGKFLITALGLLLDASTG